MISHNGPEDIYSQVDIDKAVTREINQFKELAKKVGKMLGANPKTTYTDKEVNDIVEVLTFVSNFLMNRSPGSYSSHGSFLELDKFRSIQNFRKDH